METTKIRWTLGELAESLGGELRGPADKVIRKPVPAQSSEADGIAFVTSEAYLKLALESGVGALLVPLEAPPLPVPVIAVANPREAFTRLLELCDHQPPLSDGVDPRACVADDAKIDPTAKIGPFAVVESGAVIGAHAKVYPFAYVGTDCHVGEEAVIYPHAVLYQDVRIGARSVVHAGAVLGADGFGYVWDGTRRVKVPQVGGVKLGDDVEVGALTAIDRSTSGETAIGNGTKIDNLVQIGHNTTIGEHSVIVALCGISGSTTIGSRTIFAGQAATSDHITVGDDITLGGRSGVSRDILEPGTYWGTPARPIGEEMRMMALERKLPSLFDRVKALEKKLRELEKGE